MGRLGQLRVIRDRFFIKSDELSQAPMRQIVAAEKDYVQ
jgi:hypothetical protein